MPELFDVTPNVPTRNFEAAKRATRSFQGPSASYGFSEFPVSLVQGTSNDQRLTRISLLSSFWNKTETQLFFPFSSLANFIFFLRERERENALRGESESGKLIAGLHFELEEKKIKTFCTQVGEGLVWLIEINDQPKRNVVLCSINLSPAEDPRSRQAESW